MSRKPAKASASRTSLPRTRTFGALYCVYDDDTWLKESIESVYDHCEVLLFLMAEKPWNGEPGDTGGVLRCIEQAADPDKKIKLVRGPWTNETEQRNAGLDMLAEIGMEYCFIVDADELYVPEHLQGMKEFASARPQTTVWHMTWDVYWKSHRYVVAPREPFLPVVFVKVGTERFTQNRLVGGENHGFIPPDVGFCHHLAYARSDQAIRRKITTWAHASELQSGWYDRVWKGWDADPNMVNIHPTHPPSFHHAAFQPYAALPPVLQRRFANEAPAEGDTSEQIAAYYAFTRPEVQAMVPVTARHILDIGCGAGALGKAIKKRQRCHVTGIEYEALPGRAAADVLDKVYVGDVNEIASTLPRGKFDCIVMADVLEHLPDPAKTLAALAPTLAKGGRFAVSIPNVRHWSVVGNLLQGQWEYEDAGLLDRTHLRFFTRRSFERALFRAGLRPRLYGSTTVGTDQMPPALIDAAARCGLDTASLRDESNAYQFLYTIEPLQVAADRPVVSIVILTHNQLEQTMLCLDSIERQTCVPHELILVDNGSYDGTVSYLRSYAERHDNVTVVANRANLGFAAGNNQGLALARGQYVLLLNNDTVVTDGWLERMLGVMDSGPKVGLVGPRTNNVGGPQRVPAATYTDLAGMQRFASEWERAHAMQVSVAGRLVGFCLLVRKEVVDAIGGLDERFGLGNYEDDDYCLRTLKAGFEARVAEDVFIHHTGSQTFQGAGIDYKASMARNWEIFKAKWGIAAATPMEQGYRIDAVALPAVPAVPLPDMKATHVHEAARRWWQGNQEPDATPAPAAVEPVRATAPEAIVTLLGIEGELMPGDIDTLYRKAGAVPPGGTIVEIGSFKGLSSCVMAKALADAGNLTARIICIDTWEGSPEHQGLDVIKSGQLYETFLANIRKAGADRFITPIRKPSADAAAQIPDGSADLVFIDGDHSYQGAYTDLEAYYMKVKPGGVLIGHDCTPDGGVRPALERFAKERGYDYAIAAPPASHYIFEAWPRQHAATVVRPAGRWFAAPTWADADSWQPVVEAYVRRQGADGGVLHLYAGDLTGSTADEAYARTSEFLERLGIEPDQCPDIEITTAVVADPNTHVVLSGGALDDALRREFVGRCVDVSEWAHAA